MHMTDLPAACAAMAVALASAAWARASETEPERFAAEELQHWLGAIFPEDKAALEGSDGFAVRRRDGTIYVMSPEPRGCIYGVYALIERNSDFIFPRPDSEPVFTRVPKLELREADFRERPAFDQLRGWWICGPMYHAETELWYVRQRCSMTPAVLSKPGVYERAVKFGTIINRGGGHNMPGFYTDTVQNVFGCDSIVHLQLSMALAPDPSEIQSTDPNNETPHSVISPTEFEIKTYDFTLWDNNEGSEWDSVVWSFESDITWRIEPYGENGRFCTVSVNSRVEDTVWLNATVYGHCEPGTGIERRFWLVCTFFGLDEQETPMQIDIVPNPNNGKMDIVFGQAEGKIGAKVYDMTGQLVDQFELIGSTNSRHSYTINDYRSGIYLFVFNGNGKNAIRKVVVTK